MTPKTILSLEVTSHRLKPLLVFTAGILAAYSAILFDIAAMHYLKELMLNISKLIKYFVLYINIAFIFAFLWQRYQVVQVYRTLHQSRSQSHLPGFSLPSTYRLSHILRECHRFIQRAAELERQQRTMSLQLQAVRQALLTQSAKLALQRHTHDEVQQGFLYVLHHANRLEEAIRNYRLGEEIVTDIDPLCEHAFNLQLLTKGMAQLDETGRAMPLHRFAVTDTISGILVALTSALDRRCMKLTSHHWEESLHGLAGNHHGETMLWLLLLGCIRYAADESTLSLACKTDLDHGEAVISIEINELSPGHITPEERMRYFAAKAVHHECETHLFAHTLKANANLVLADLLAKQANGSVQIVPKTNYSCEVQLRLRLA